MCNTFSKSFAGLATCLAEYLGIQVVSLLIGFATIVFLWGVLKFVKNSGNETERVKGKQLMIWGIVGLFVMLCVWAIVGILESTFSSSRGLIIPQL